MHDDANAEREQVTQENRHGGCCGGQPGGDGSSGLRRYRDRIVAWQDQRGGWVVESLGKHQMTQAA